MQRAVRSFPLGAAVLIGLVGLLTGYIGPLAFHPEMNQGPLVGIFFTGPIAFLLGLALGYATVRLRLNRISFLVSVTVVIIVVVAGSLYLSALP